MADFNPRSRKGSDQTADAATISWWEFQSTLPQGERRYTADGLQGL